MDVILNEFREYFLSIMTAQENAESLPGEDLAIEEPPSAKEFVEHVLAANLALARKRNWRKRRE